VLNVHDNSESAFSNNSGLKLDNDAIPYSQEVYPEKSFFFFGARIPREKLVDSASGEASVSAMVLIESLQNT